MSDNPYFLKPKSNRDIIEILLNIHKELEKIKLILTQIRGNTNR